MWEAERERRLRSFWNRRGERIFFPSRIEKKIAATVADSSYPPHETWGEQVLPLLIFIVNSRKEKVKDYLPRGDAQGLPDGYTGPAARPGKSGYGCTARSLATSPPVSAARFADIFSGGQSHHCSARR